MPFRWVLSLLLLPFAASGGYLDASGRTIADRDPILQRLDKLFSGHCPRSVRITRSDQHPSEFHPSDSSVELGTDATAESETMVLTHETAHLCMARLTRGASNTEPYRFYDEGFASIVGGDYSSSFRKSALQTAARKAQSGGVSFALVQKWSKYFGHPPRADYDAYAVGASFVFFVQDRYGQDKLFAFFRATGETASLDAACRSAFGAGAAVLEKNWLDYLSRASLAGT